MLEFILNYSKEMFRTMTMVKITQANILAHWQNTTKYLDYTYLFCPAQDKACMSKRE